MSDLTDRLRAVSGGNIVLAGTLLWEAANEIDRLTAERDALREALELIAAPMRPDGTWNRERLACQQIAVAALKGET